MRTIINSFASVAQPNFFDAITGEAGNWAIQDSTLIWSSDTVVESKSVSFAYKKMQGDFILTLQMTSREAQLHFGLKINGADNFSCKSFLDQESLISVESTQFPTQLCNEKIANPNVFQVERRGDLIIFSAAKFGQPLLNFATVELNTNDLFDNALLVGIYREFDSVNTGLYIENLRWVKPAWENLIPYTDYLGSRLEVLDILNGSRNVLYETQDGIEAPNWSPDGKYLIFNSQGKLYKFDLATKNIAEINTGFATKNNNDHVLSFDGKYLGISHHAAEYDGKSIIYSLALEFLIEDGMEESLEAGALTQLTFEGPSYLHGWSPDNKYLIYTAERNGQFDIYRTTADGKGEEIQLTNTQGLADGSEYSPDGQYIYFNSSQTGVMQLWRMDADGKNPIQLTSDQFNNWFPHVSPDETQLLFLSYLPEIAADQHPYYQQVYLRALSLPKRDDRSNGASITGTLPKVVAYLYGGQGTINVPSWSPDGRYAAFVSNSQM